MAKPVPPLHTPIVADQIITADVWQKYFTSLYAEGLWTPVLGGSTGTAGQTYSNQVGRYVKLGRLVIAMAVLTLTAKGTVTGTLQVLGLPFRAEKTPGHHWSATIGYFRLATPWSSIQGVVFYGAAEVTLYGVPTPQNFPVGLAPADLADSSQIMLTVTYLAQV